MKVLTAEQIRFADKFTIQNLPVSSIDLMEKAAAACFRWITQNIDKESFIFIFCGPGNNGGDGLAIARMLHQHGYSVKAMLLNVHGHLSSDCKTNFERLLSIDKQLVDEITSVPEEIPFAQNSIVIDALFGTGLTRGLDEETGKLVRLINNSGCRIISIDLPSGIYSDKTSLNSGSEIVKASTTLTFQYMKLGLLVGENAAYFGRVEVLDISLLDASTDSMDVKTFLIEENDIKAIFHPKANFSHKGSFGHSLLVAGGKGKMGAAILAAHGYLKSGAGLLTVMVPESGVSIIQTGVPEAMAWEYDDLGVKEIMLPEINFTAIGAGPGMGTETCAISVIGELLKNPKCPLVVDADGLNILSMKPEWFKRLPKGTILTPHPGEFKRMSGGWSDDFEKLAKQSEFSKKYEVYLLLKGKNTSIACPDGTMYFNPTGNAGMAKGGSGDILTGLLTGLLASGYHAKEACILGVYLHGLAGDLAAKKLTQEAMNAGDIIAFLPEAWKVVGSGR